jgi:two-component sensor histidine kinase/PAS domain-containing protein
VTSSFRQLPGSVQEVLGDTDRRSVLAELALADMDDDPDFDRLVRLAAAGFGVPTAVISLIDRDNQQVRASIGLDGGEKTIDFALNAHALAVRDPDYLAIENVGNDPRFSHTKAARCIGFYAGAPISVRGQRIGVVAVAAPEPRGIDPAFAAQLTDLAAMAGSLFALKDEARVRARTAAALIREEWRHALTLEAGKVGSWVWDLRSDDIVANDIFRRMYDLPADSDVTGSDILSAVHPADRPDVDVALKAAFDEGVDYVSEFRIGSTGRWLLARGRVYQRDGEGKPLIMMGVHLDLTETREAAEQTQLLLRELNHRVKNTLAMIQSLARQTMRRNPDPESFIAAFSGRLRTLSDSHSLLSDRDWSGIGLVELVALQVEASNDFASQQLELLGEDVFLPPDHALGLGLVLHELTSNAVRFGALSVPGGRVRLAWSQRQADGHWLDLVWRESGGPPVKAPGEYGLGGRLIERSLAKVLDSSVELDFPPDGVEARISLPLPV